MTEAPRICPECSRTTIYELGVDEEERENVWCCYVCAHVWRVEQ